MKKNSKFMEVFDALFILVLCFATLLTTMLTRGAVIVGSGSSGGGLYDFNLISFGATMLGLGAYLLYIIPRSDKQLKKMVDELYKDK